MSWSRTHLPIKRCHMLTDRLSKRRADHGQSSLEAGSHWLYSSILDWRMQTRRKKCEKCSILEWFNLSVKASPFLPSLLSLSHSSFLSSSLPRHAPASSVHHLSPWIQHRFSLTVYLPSLSPPLQHINPSCQCEPSHSCTFSSLFISALSLSLSLSLQHHTLPLLSLWHIFFPFVTSPPLNENIHPFTCPPLHPALTVYLLIPFFSRENCRPVMEGKSILLLLSPSLPLCLILDLLKLSFQSYKVHGLFLIAGIY